MRLGTRKMWRCLALCAALCLAGATLAASTSGAASAEAAQGQNPPEDTAPPAVRKVVYLTFDDGPGRLTPELLALLDTLDVKATFFLIGRAVTVYPAHVRAIRDAGHAIASHSYSHSRKVLGSPGGFTRDMRKFDAAIEAALGEPLEIRVFRFPYGSRWATRELRKQVSADGYLWVDWNALNEDANTEYMSDPAKMMRRALATSGKRTEIVFLMHEGKRHSMNMLPELVAYYREAGYEFDVLTLALDHEIDGVNMGLPKPAASPAPKAGE